MRFPGGALHVDLNGYHPDPDQGIGADQALASGSPPRQADDYRRTGRLSWQVDEAHRWGDTAGEAALLTELAAAYVELGNQDGAEQALRRLSEINGEATPPDP